jgi:hypothetical protein
MKKIFFKQAIEKYHIENSSDNMAEHALVIHLRKILDSPQIVALQDDDDLSPETVAEIFQYTGMEWISASSNDWRAKNLLLDLKIAIYKEMRFDALLDKLDDGDLVYGFREIRIALIEQSKETKTFNFIIDRFNDIARHFASQQKDFSFPVFSTSSKKAKHFYAKTDSLHKFAQRFEGVKDKDYYKKSTSAMYEKINGTGLDDFVRKRCKLGILWCLSEGKTIHILLDQYDFAQCFSKEPKKYTYSEMRFIYRNWNGLQRFHHAKKIIFYVMINGILTEVTPPWVADSLIGSSYMPKDKAIRQKKNALYGSFITEMADRILGPSGVPLVEWSPPNMDCTPDPTLTVESITQVVSDTTGLPNMMHIGEIRKESEAQTVFVADPAPLVAPASVKTVTKQSVLPIDCCFRSTWWELKHNFPDCSITEEDVILNLKKASAEYQYMVFLGSYPDDGIPGVTKQRLEAIMAALPVPTSALPSSSGRLLSQQGQGSRSTTTEKKCSVM